MLCPFCGPRLCLEVKYYRQDMTQNFSEPCYFTNKKKTKKQNQQQQHMQKTSKIHPRQTLMQWRKIGREAQAPLGTQPEGVPCLSGTCSVSLYSGLLLLVRKQSPTDRQTLPFSTFWWNMKSVAGGEDQILGQFSSLKGWGGSNFYSWA